MEVAKDDFLEAIVADLPRGGGDLLIERVLFSRLPTILTKESVDRQAESAGEPRKIAHARERTALP